MSNLDGLYKALEIITKGVEEAPAWVNSAEILDRVVVELKEEINREIEEYERNKREI